MKTHKREFIRYVFKDWYNQSFITIKETADLYQDKQYNRKVKVKITVEEI